MSRFLSILSDTWNAERERWILWMPVCLGTGIALYFSLPFEPSRWTGPIATAVVLAAAWAKLLSLQSALEHCNFTTSNEVPQWKIISLGRIARLGHRLRTPRQQSRPHRELYKVDLIMPAKANIERYRIGFVIGVPVR